MVPQDYSAFWLLLDYPAIDLPLRLGEVFLITRLEIGPVLLFEIMVVHTHLCLGLLLLV